jgi:oligosaccharide repeat unit polymerase
MGITILFILALMIAGFLYFRIGDMFSPWMLTVGIWFFILFLLLTQKGLLYPLGDQFYVCLFIWVPILCLSSIITYLVMPKVKNEEVTKKSSIDINKGMFNCVFLILMIIAPLYLYKVLKIVSAYDMTDFLYNIRLYNIFGDTSFGILNYAHVFGQAALVIALWRYPKMPLWQVVLIVMANLMCVFAIMTKTTLLFLFVAIIFVLYEKGIVKARSIFISSIVIVCIFFFFNVARESQSDGKADSWTMLDFICMYILSPSVAFGYVGDNLSSQFGYSTFSAIYQFLNGWGLGNYEIRPGIQDFVFVPIPTNVYTIFQPFFEDFRYEGIAFFALVYGVFTGMAYRLCRNGNAAGKCIYTFFVLHLILQFFMEDIITSFVAFIEFSLLVLICTQSKFSITFHSDD